MQFFPLIIRCQNGLLIARMNFDAARTTRYYIWHNNSGKLEALEVEQSMRYIPSSVICAVYLIMSSFDQITRYSTAKVIWYYKYKFPPFISK